MITRPPNCTSYCPGIGSSPSPNPPRPDRPNRGTLRMLTVERQLWGQNPTDLPPVAERPVSARRRHWRPEDDGRLSTPRADPGVGTKRQILSTSRLSAAPD